MVAAEQTSGRGRLGRRWLAAPGTALLCSVLLRPGPERPLTRVSAALTEATAGVLETLARRRVEIKWPNDLEVGGRKLAGILPEAVSSPGSGEAGPGYLVWGLGVNVSAAPALSPGAAAAPISLAELTGGPADRLEVLAALIPALRREYAALPASWPHVLERWTDRCSTLGREVLVSAVTSRGRPWRALALDLDGEGRLLVRRPGASRAQVLWAGEVRHLRHSTLEGK